MSRTLLVRALTALAALVPLLGMAGPAMAAEAPAEPVHAWSASVTTVCVESHVRASWDVKGALRQWNRLDGGPTFVLEPSCAEYDDSVTVQYKNADTRFTGWSNWYWDATGHMVHADVTVNPERLATFDRADRACMRQHTMTHEFGHVLGLRHYPHSHAGAVMSYLGWQKRCGALDAHDRSDFRKLYPATS